MILKASQRGGAKQLGLHLLKTEENEHVEIHEVSGFICDDILGAMKEAQAISMGTKCKQHLFSASFNPPQNETAPPQVFETAINKVEERLGLTGQPRIIVFHEKEGRRHAHCVWSRINAAEMKAVHMSHFKNKMQNVARELYMENGWKMPDGLRDQKNRDPRSFTLAEWQQSKRIGRDPRDLKSAIQDAWNISDNRQSFKHALEDRGLFLAKGDKKGHVAITYDGEIISIARYTGKKAKEVRERLGNPDDLRSVAETKTHIANFMNPQMRKYLQDAKFKSFKAMKPLQDRRRAITDHHKRERTKLDQAQKARWAREELTRTKRMNKGFSGLWDKLTGKQARTRKQNELETFHALERDKKQRHDLISAQLGERKGLQSEIQQLRHHAVKEQSQLHKDLASYKRMQERYNSVSNLTQLKAPKTLGQASERELEL